MPKHYQNEVGTDILLDTGIDLNDILVQEIWYEKPGGVKGSWSGTLYNSYSPVAKAIGTYYVSYTLTQTSGTYDLDTVGDWKFQAFVANGTGSWYGETQTEQIYDQWQ